MIHYYEFIGENIFMVDAGKVIVEISGEI